MPLFDPDPGKKIDEGPKREPERDPKLFESIPRDRMQREADRRNQARILAANEKDKEIIGKFLPPDPKVFFPFRIAAPEDSAQQMSPEWCARLMLLSKVEVPTPDKPQVMFDLTDEAIAANTRYIESCGGDMTTFMDRMKGTTIGHGSEFRPVDHIQQVLMGHHRVVFLSELFRQGMDYHFKSEVSELARVRELAAQIERGNHKSAKENLEEVTKCLAKDVKHGFALPVSPKCVPNILGAMVQPCGMAFQFSLNPDGSRVEKGRLTHDLSHSLTHDKASVNSRVDMNRYPEMIYGWCLGRTIHFIVALRHKYPNRRIYISKFDYSDAYRRVSHAGSAAAKTILIVKDVAYIMLRLAFGGSPNPPTFCGFSEALTDLANDLSHSTYDPKKFPAPTVEERHCVPKIYDMDQEPFGEGVPVAFDIPLTPTTRKDCFVDDIINVFLSTPENLAREVHTVPMAAHLLSRPHAGENVEPIPRRPLFAPNKVDAEGRPAERQVCLGWELDCHKLTVSLPIDKFRAWDNDVKKILEEGKTTRGEFESTVGRLNHASYVIPLSRHFLNRLRLRIQTRRPPKMTIRLNEDEIFDLQLWRTFLQQSRAGISMNLLVIRHPTRLGWSDSCPFGIGGYTLSGTAFRIKIPKEASFYGIDEANNVLEFLGMAITILLLIREAGQENEQHPSILALGDSTTGIGWLFKSSRVPPSSRYYKPLQFIARHVASEVTKSGCQLSAQHLEGSKNDVADLLSYDGSERGKDNPLTVDEPPNDVLSHRILSSYPQFVPHSFEISELPDEIISFACAALQTLESSWTRKVKPATAGLRGLGRDGNVSSEVLESITPSSIRVFDQSGRIVGQRQRPMVAASIRDAASNLGQTFLQHRGANPLHVSAPTGGGSLLAEPLKSLLRAFETADPPPNRQAALTPELLKKLWKTTQRSGVVDRHTTDLIIGGFFFAMRACEFCHTRQRGRTKVLTLGNVTFRRSDKSVIRQSDPALLQIAQFVTVCFVDQKNGKKMDKRTQGRSGRKDLCPVRAWARVVARVRVSVEDADDNTSVCSLSDSGNTVKEITAEKIQQLLRSVCRLEGGKDKFGFGPDQLGTRSIRSGAAMALFLNNHSIEKIKILGRWSSDAFIAYIRPQVLEWTSVMAQDMTKMVSFLDLSFEGSRAPQTEGENWRELGLMPTFSRRK